jgi:enediyne biosynthesis protein E4
VNKLSIPFAVWLRYFFLVSIGTLAVSCHQLKPDRLLIAVPPTDTKINFENVLTEDTTFNIIEYLYFYNGGGVAIGDINNDGLSDIYFSGNQVSNKLYLNKGDFKFEDITYKANASGVGNWHTGVSMVDVNADGFLDMFICGVGGYKQFNSRNQLLINNHDLTFTDKTAEYGLDFTGLSTQISFFDFDLDGDLDCYLLNHSVHSSSAYVNASQRLNSDSLSGDQFFRNDLIKDGINSGITKFKSVTREVGILNSRLGYGLGIGVSDVNWDGYPDIYISNDFHENDYLYLNNRRGGFNQVLEKSMAHTSRFSMGNDMADVNNDCLTDIFTLDMLPQDEAVIKTSSGEDTYQIHKFKRTYGYHEQASRNCLQINQFVTDTSVWFSDVAMLAGVGATDWSWAPLLADFDQDGFKDLFISNGILRRPNNLDYINFISDASVQSSLRTLEAGDLKVLDMMPSGQVANYFFRNTGKLLFEDVSKDWGIDQPSLSNGAAYGDLDNDGDLDLVINNLNAPSSVLRNNAAKRDDAGVLTIKLIGPTGNPMGIGAKIIAYSGQQNFYQEAFYTRGFCSSVDPRINLGVGNNHMDSVVIIWPDFKKEVIREPKINTLISLCYISATQTHAYSKRSGSTLLKPLKQRATPAFVHQEDDFSAFDIESLIPHALTHEGPAMAVGDVNGDGLDDVFFGGGKGQESAIFIKTQLGEWKNISTSIFSNSKSEVTAAAFFDADKDQDLDLVVAFGGQEEFSPAAVTPRLYINEGNEKFRAVKNSFSGALLNASCVQPMDYDKDGDVDLFLGSSVMPQLYGMSPVSYLLDNNGEGFFTPNVRWLGKSQFDNPTIVRPGMVKDAVWTKVNSDDLIDLILVGEWMPITILIQQPDHTFQNQTQEYQLQATRGWWNSIAAADFDSDGDEDWMVGNFGLNSRLRASESKPLLMYLGDFDSNGGSDHILVYYNGNKNYPFASRDQLVKQLPSLKKKFLHYEDYRNVNLDDIITPLQKGNSAMMRADILESVYLENTDDGIKLSKLPIEAQVAPIFSICPDDINNDGFLDVLLGGNLSVTQPDLGPYDASQGLVMLGDGRHGWNPMPAMQSGLVVQGDVSDIKRVKHSSGKFIYLITRNNQLVTGYQLSK